MIERSFKVIFDTNVWISFLIGKRLASLKEAISTKRITLIITSQLLMEIEVVTKREKLKKYFPENSVAELLELLETIGKTLK
jgi:hypothetical protein